jgi:quercetin dioxygenase-like cupin family protein
MNKAKRSAIGLGLVVVICCMVLAHEKAGPDKVLAAQAAQAAMKKAKGTTDASGVMYFSHEETAEAFKDSVMLYDGVPQKNYRVAVYHREKGGEVEIHKKDTDVFYIVEGSATFVTGGTITGGKETAPDEIRMATMEGGVERKIGKGDVIVVPANVTHWYKEVQQPITYFGVKVR